MTKKRFWEDPYLNQLETQVTQVNGPDITVEQTIFFAFSGGQESDTGTIGNHRVLQARKAGKEIVYTLEHDHGLRPGDPVRICIDWERRYTLMRLHFAAEIVLENRRAYRPGQSAHRFRMGREYLKIVPVDQGKGANHHRSGPKNHQRFCR
jgi:Ser-tRNA(Ala) deacylase AlaX